MNSVCANCQNKGTFIHEFSIQYCSIIYPTRLRDKRTPPCTKGCHVPLTAFYRPVKALLKKTKAGKAAGVDEVGPDLLRPDIEGTAGRLTRC